jgi:hypothetical protein
MASGVGAGLPIAVSKSCKNPVLKPDGENKNEGKSQEVENEKRGVARWKNVFRGDGMQLIYPLQDMVASRLYEQKDWMAGMS